MAVAQASVPYFDMGRVVKRTFSVIGRNAVTFFLLALVPGLALFTISWIARSFPDRPAGFGQFSLTAIAWFVVTMIVYLFSLFILQAAVIHGTVADLNGKRAPLLNCLMTGLSNLVPLFLIALLVGIGTMLGLILFVVPGIIVMVAWSVAVPARIVEHTGAFDSVSRSRDLTSGYRWSILGLFGAYFLLQLAIGMVYGVFIGVTMMTSADGLSAAVGVTKSLPYIAASSLVQMINAVIASAGIASIYYELRVLKDGIGPEALAAVFD